jgi:hypothetical protein
MPRGPKGQKRPADVNQRAVLIARIATGEVDDIETPSQSAAAQLGAKGGKARAAKLKKSARVEIARKAANKRWGNTA